MKVYTVPVRLNFDVEVLADNLRQAMNTTIERTLAGSARHVVLSICRSGLVVDELTSKGPVTVAVIESVQQKGEHEHEKA